ncbi:hypothetical protein D3C72_1394290 [compost metagenome]
MADAAVPVTWILRQARRTRHVELVGHGLADDAVGQFRLARIFGVDGRIVPPFGGMDAGGHLPGLLLGGRRVPQGRPVEHRQGRHDVIQEQFALVVAEDDGDISLCRLIDVGHAFDRRATRRVTAGAFLGRGAFAQPLVLPQFDQRRKVIGLAPERVILAGVVGRKAQQPFFGRGGQGRAVGGPQAQHDLGHRRPPYRSRLKTRRALSSKIFLRSASLRKSNLAMVGAMWSMVWSWPSSTLEPTPGHSEPNRH